MWESLVFTKLKIKLGKFPALYFSLHLILANHIYTSQRQYASKRVAVVEPVVEVPQTTTDPINYGKMEIICPDVVLPGTFFNCTADIPKGQGLVANITFTSTGCKITWGPK